jgi:hypothetical protein
MELTLHMLMVCMMSNDKVLVIKNKLTQFNNAKCFCVLSMAFVMEMLEWYWGKSVPVSRSETTQRMCL